MRIEDYPAQEPFPALSRKYHDAVMARPSDRAAHEERYGADPYQSLALHLPARPDGTVLAFLHGGGWTNGYKEWVAFMAPALTAAGVIFATIGYRLAPAHVFPAGFEDAARALAWLHRHVADYGGDAARLFVGGHSAGGHYAALLAVRRDWQAGLELPADVVRGCLPVSGVFDFTAGSGLAMRPRFLGPAETERAASPIHQIGAAPPPFLIAHGERDFPHLVRQAGAMAAALEAAGGAASCLVLPGCDHLEASYAAGEADGPWLEPALAWLEDH